MAKHSSQILELAKRGAEARFQDLVHEAKLLVLAFPHLRDSFDKDELPVSFIVARGSGRLTKRKAAGRRGPTSTAGKSASARKKKRAVKRRASKG